MPIYINNRITSFSNPKIRNLIALSEKQKERRGQGLFVVEGYRELRHCIDCGFKVDSMDPAPTRADIQSVFAGLRPLAAPKKEGKSSKELSRSHKIIVSGNKLVTITGGKWTSYRKMAEDTLDKAMEIGLLDKRKCQTRFHHLHGYHKNPDLNDHLYVYGSDEDKIKELIAKNPEMGEKLSEKYGYTVAEVIWAVREEMAETVDDVLARRVRLLFIDAREAQKAAPKVAEIMAKELGRDQAWIDAQVADFTAISNNYFLKD